jgi:hypothetical protein
LSAGYDVVEALHFRTDAAKAVKADAALAGVDSLTEGGGSHEIELLEVGAAQRRNSRGCLDAAKASAGNFFREPQVYHVTRFAALDQAQCAVLDETAQRGAHGFFRET